jgi:hypothetical protein
MRITSFKSLATAAAVGALALGFTVMAPASAQASSATRSAITSPIVDESAPVEMQRRGGFRGGGFRGGRPGFRGGRGGRGFGPGAALGLGAAALIIGGAAAAASAGPRECWIERRWVDTPWGPEPRRVRVCN